MLKNWIIVFTGGLPIHLFRHFCSRMYRLVTMQCTASQTDKQADRWTVMRIADNVICSKKDYKKSKEIYTVTETGHHMRFYILSNMLLCSALDSTYLALRSSGPCQDNGQQDFAICSCL